MDLATAQLMQQLTADFYCKLGDAFYRTRAQAWAGWEPLFELIAKQELGTAQGTVLDMACGGLRFERELIARGSSVQFWALDTMDPPSELPLTQGGTSTPNNAAPLQAIHYVKLDIASALMETGALNAELRKAQVPLVQTAVSLAFTHHLPLEAQRHELIRALLTQVIPGGLAGVSFWQFGDDMRLRTKAESVTRAARERFDLSSFGPNDYLMGWDGSAELLRYCHHCSDTEIENLKLEAAKFATVVADYRADGASGTLNRYLVLRKND